MQFHYYNNVQTLIIHDVITIVIKVVGLQRSLYNIKYNIKVNA